MARAINSVQGGPGNAGRTTPEVSAARGGRAGAPRAGARPAGTVGRGGAGGGGGLDASGGASGGGGQRDRTVSEVGHAGEPALEPGALVPGERRTDPLGPPRGANAAAGSSMAR